MKGIKKLFLGLVFMTLISVGFKVDAKAAPNISFNINPADWGTNPKLEVKLNYTTPAVGTPGDFPEWAWTTAADDGNGTYNYLVQIKKQNYKTI